VGRRVEGRGERERERLEGKKRERAGLRGSGGEVQQGAAFAGRASPCSLIGRPTPARTGVRAAILSVGVVFF